MFECAAQKHSVDRATFRREQATLRAQLLEAQFEFVESRHFSVIILFAGIDGAGKGAALHRLYGWLDPRQLKANAYGAPDEAESLRPNMWRYWRDLPAKGGMSIVFGSWYTPVLRARALGETREIHFEHDLYAINRFEEMLTNEGTRILKFWFHIPPDEQKKRLRKIAKDPNPNRHIIEDWSGTNLHEQASNVGEVAVRITSTGHAPWIVVPSISRHYRDLMMGRAILENINRQLVAPPPEAALPAPALVAQIDRKTVLDSLDMSQKLDDASYRKQLRELQARIASLADSRAFGKKALVVAFEGNDAAGKGGSIRRLIQALDPRRVVAHSIAAPNEVELAHPYLWRFWRKVPRKGHIAVFDRSWYGRVLVERVEGYCTEAEWLRAYSEINDFERELAAADIVLVKFWLSITKDEQLRRFKEREKVPFKRHKITEEDWRNREKWDAYATAVGDMVDRTSTDYARWTLIEAEDKKFARIKVLRTICEQLEAAMHKTT